MVWSADESGRAQRRSGPRLTLQARRILDRLQAGRATNWELRGISAVWEKRVQELIDAGYDCRRVESKPNGIAVWTLYLNNQEVARSAVDDAARE